MKILKKIIIEKPGPGRLGRHVDHDPQSRAFSVGTASRQDRHLQALWQALRSGRPRILHWECDGRGTHDRASLGSRA